MESLSSNVHDDHQADLDSPAIGMDMLLQAAQSSELSNAQTSPVALEPTPHHPDTNKRVHGLFLPGLRDCGLLVKCTPTSSPNSASPSVSVTSRISIPSLLNSPLPVEQHRVLHPATLTPPPVSRCKSLPGSPMASERRASLSRGSPHLSSAGVFACTHTGCTKAFPSRSRLQRHLIVHSNEKPFLCPFEACCRRFSRRDNMLQHSKSHRREP